MNSAADQEKKWKFELYVVSQDRPMVNLETLFKSSLLG